MQRILSLFSYTLFSAGLALLLQLGLYFLVAHHTQPEELGYYFIASTLIFIPAGMFEYGFVSSLIQMKEPQPRDYNAVFRINQKFCWFYLPIGLGLSFLLSWFYGTNAYAYYFIMLLPILVLATYNSVQNAGLKKALRIKIFAGIELIGTISMVLVTVCLLYKEWGVMALVIGQLVRAISVSLALYFKASYLKMRGTKATADEREKHWNYGKYILVEKSMGIGISHVDVFLINHILGAQTVGIYDLLKRMVLRPLISAYNAMEHVTFPLLAEVSDNPSKFRAVFSKIVKSNYFFFLSLTGLFLANWVLGFFPAIYHDKAELLQLIILLALSMMILNPVDIVAYSLDRTRRYYKWVLCYGSIQILVMLFSLTYSLNVFLVAMIVYNLLVYGASYFVVVRRDSGILFTDWIRPVFYFSCCVVITYILL